MVTDCGGDSERASVHPRSSLPGQLDINRTPWCLMKKCTDGLMKERLDNSLMEVTKSLTGEPVR